MSKSAFQFSYGLKRIERSNIDLQIYKWDLMSKSVDSVCVKVSSVNASTSTGRKRV